jgi:hypothetical protein
MVVGVVADRVPGVDDAAQPGNALLLEDSADGEEMGHAAMVADAPAGLDRVAFGFLVEIAFLVVPVDGFPGGEVAAHLEIERDGDQGAVAQIGDIGGGTVLGETGRCYGAS